MCTFDEIYAIAADRKAGSDALEALLPSPTTNSVVLELPEDRWLSLFTKCIFQAGFSWKEIESKWDGFETAFHGFDVSKCAMMNDEMFDDLLTNSEIVRNGTKIQTVRDNAVFLSELREQGGASAVIGGWSPRDQIGLLELLKSKGSRLGGTTGQYALRFAGKDSFILSKDVTARLIAEGVIAKPAGSKTSMRAVQGAFNAWMDQSNRSLTQISRILAMSV